MHGDLLCESLILGGLLCGSLMLDGLLYKNLRQWAYIWIATMSGVAGPQFFKEDRDDFDDGGQRAGVSEGSISQWLDSVEDMDADSQGYNARTWNKFGFIYLSSICFVEGAKTEGKDMCA